MEAATVEERIRGLERVCRSRGLPLTIQRRVVFEAIVKRNDHPTADQILEQIKDRVPDISRTTIYRILDTFVQLGLITKICHPSAVARFEPKLHQHHHLICMHCEQIIDLENERLNTVAFPDVRRQDFQITDYHIHFRGICSACQSKTAGAGNSPRNKAEHHMKSAEDRKE
jgi:Fur family peroxide stress response transcriptional regulator